MDITGRANSLDEESQRLENWYLLLGELTDCLWYPEDLPGLLEGFCKILVLRAGYSHTEIFFDNNGQTSRFEATSTRTADLSFTPPEDERDGIHALVLDFNIAPQMHLKLSVRAPLNCMKQRNTGKY